VKARGVVFEDAGSTAGLGLGATVTAGRIKGVLIAGAGLVAPVVTGAV